MLLHVPTVSWGWLCCHCCVMTLLLAVGSSLADAPPCSSISIADFVATAVWWASFQDSFCSFVGFDQFPPIESNVKDFSLSPSPPVPVSYPFFVSFPSSPLSLLHFSVALRIGPRVSYMFYHQAVVWSFFISLWVSLTKLLRLASRLSFLYLILHMILKGVHHDFYMMVVKRWGWGPCRVPHLDWQDSDVEWPKQCEFSDTCR